MTGARYPNILQHLVVDLPEQIDVDALASKAFGY
jgi:hypothetical protein